MSTEEGTITEDQKKAESFNKHFSSVHKAEKLMDSDRERIKDLKRKEKAPGANAMGTKGKEIILDLINMTWRTGTIPTKWKIATISPILKKGKPAEELKSYRPISLTSCLCKLAERIINSRLYWWLEITGTLSTFQAGFRPGQRTEDQLFRLTQRIIDGFQRGENTTAIFVDLQQAYDRV